MGARWGSNALFTQTPSLHVGKTDPHRCVLTKSGDRAKVRRIRVIAEKDLQFTRGGQQSRAGLLSSCSHLSYLASDAPSPCPGPPELLTKSKNQNLNLKKTECRKLKSNQDLPRSCPTSDEGRTAELIPLLHNINRPAKVTRPLRISRVWLNWHQT